jgi:peptide/nickel transport system permease protein
MSTYGAYVGKRLGQFLLVIFIGLNIAFFVTHLTPIDPIEESISVATAFGSPVWPAAAGRPPASRHR